MDRDEMLEKSKNEQLLAEFSEEAPRMYRSLFDGCLRAGFTEDQAMKIVIAFVQKPTTT